MTDLPDKLFVFLVLHRGHIVWWDEMAVDVVNTRCCGLDIHKKSVVACVLISEPDGLVKRELRTFGTMTVDLLALADWLTSLRVTHVALESTGVYWRPVFNLIEDEGRTLVLVNPQHMRAVPGRKTDVKDAEWIADLLLHGLLRPSFIPPAPIRTVRELTRLLAGANGGVQTLLGRDAAEERQVATRSGVEGELVELDAVVDGRDEVRPRDRGALRVADGHQRHVCKAPIERLRLGQVQPAVEGGDHRDSAVARERVAPVIQVTMEDVELVHVTPDGIQCR